MRNTRDNDLAERRSAASDAKAALLQAYRTARETGEPTRLARQEERLALAAASDERRAEREKIKLEEQEQQRKQVEAAEREAAADAAARALVEAHQKAEDRISRVIEDEAARKAERDRRYANRRARQR